MGSRNGRFDDPWPPCLLPSVSSILHDQAKVLPVSSTVVYRGAVVVEEEVDAIEGRGTITRERKRDSINSLLDHACECPASRRRKSNMF